MGTRAQFFVGNPCDVENRIWLGTVAWDGYPSADCGELAKATDEASFREIVAKLAASRDDWCDPAKNSFPFPWKDDLFLTDCTYAWFDGAVQFTWFHNGFMPLTKYLALSDDESEEWGNEDRLPASVPAPVTAGPRGPDSIMIISVPR